MTHYFGNLPLVGKKRTKAFIGCCENCQQEKSFYWVKPYSRTIIGSIFGRLQIIHNPPRGICLKLICLKKMILKIEINQPLLFAKSAHNSKTNRNRCRGHQ